MNGTTHDIRPAPGDSTQKWSFAAGLSSVISAFVASACCIGPLVFGLLGIGGAGLLVKFEPYRPYFIAATFALLGTGFYFTYRKTKVTAVVEGVACACEMPGANRVGKITLWVATALVVAFLAFPYLAPLLLE